MIHWNCPIRTRGFTLIELIIVVAIIAILASIAVPNFMDAQIRAKVSRAQADMRSITIALETYRVDNNKYPLTPLDALGDRDLRLMPLTTPVSYLGSLPQEIFSRRQFKIATYPYWSVGLTNAMKTAPEPNLFYHLRDEMKKLGRWSLFSRGPDLDYETAMEEGGGGFLMVYDSTNGTVSNGDIMRFGQ